MISPDRLLLQQQIYNFLRSVTIKFDVIAQYINENLAKQGYAINDNDPSTWKYYLNMAGKYHESDTPMYVTSLDTRQSILFSPEVLANNLRTRAVYTPGGSYYNRLCETYPEQVDLIKSILFPVQDITKAIHADNFTLLAYGSGYLEEYEESVSIMEIEKFLEIYKERWYFDFLDDEPYFYITAWGSLWTYLAMLLMSARVAHIRTPYVHSWDIWNELQSKGLDNYSDILERDKAMMLYQNIDYFKANAGKQSNLIILANRLLGSFGIGLYGRMVVQEAETGAANYQLTPQLVPVRLPSKSQALPANIEIKTVAVVQSEIFEKGLTPSNANEVVDAIERKLGDTTLNEFSTKFLEIRPIAQHKPYAETLNMFLMESLITSIKEGYYAKPVEVFDPLTRAPIYLPPSELLALYNYAVLKSMGIEGDGFPDRVRLFRAFAPTIGTPAKTIPHYNTTLYLSTQVDVDAYLADLNYDTNIQTPAEFGENVTKLWLRFMDHLLADQNTKLEKRHHIYDYLSTLCHVRREESIHLVSGYSTYSEWLGPGGIDIHDTILSQYDIQVDPKIQWSNLADTIISSLIPMNPTLFSFGNFTLSDSGYERLRQLFIQMCSYRVVFLESERDTPEFAIGAKWSSEYGPDLADSYSDFIVATHMNTIDHSVMASDLKLHEGASVEVITGMDSHVTYTAQMSSTATSSTSQQYGELPSMVSNVSSTTMTQGALRLSYAPMTPVMLKP